MCNRKVMLVIVVLGLAGLMFGSAEANWFESFDGAQPDLNWTWGAYPYVTGTFTTTVQTAPGGNKYVSMDETTMYDTGAGSYGSAFGMGFGSAEDFTDVRIGAIVNVIGDASYNYCGVAARTAYFVDADGSVTGAPGLVATASYILHVNWDNGPANLSMDLEKIVMMQNIMDKGIGVAVPGLGHNRSYYAELDVVGSDPVYVTGSLYEYKGGPLVARTPTLVDTNANDPWEDTGVNDAVFASGLSGVFGQNENTDVVGYHATFDDVFSVSDGPAAVNPGPANGATGVSNTATLSWKEANFATGRQLMFGKAGEMELVTPGPTGTTFNPGPLELDQSYQWRVDQTGPGGTVTGHVWTFTTAPCTVVESFESYQNNLEIEAAWPHNIGVPWHYVFLGIDADKVHSGVKAMTYEYQNQAEPFFTVATKTFATVQNWAGSYKALSITFRGEDNNYEQPLYVEVEDTLGHKCKVEHPYLHACQSESWIEWSIDLQQFADAGVNLAAIYKLSLGTGSGANSCQPAEDRDFLYIDDIRVCPARCFNSGNLDMRGDINGDCTIDFEDLAAMCAGWLNNGLSAAP